MATKAQAAKTWFMRNHYNVNGTEDDERHSKTILEALAHMEDAATREDAVLDCSSGGSPSSTIVMKREDLRKIREAVACLHADYDGLIYDKPDVLAMIDTILESTLERKLND